eukprot:scaffold83687_cov56-Attheya_sp.AAC.1
MDETSVADVMDTSGGVFENTTKPDIAVGFMSSDDADTQTQNNDAMVDAHGIFDVIFEQQWMRITALKKARSSSRKTRPVEALVNIIAEQVYNVEQKQVSQKSNEEAAGEKLADGTLYSEPNVGGNAGG